MYNPLTRQLLLEEIVSRRAKATGAALGDTYLNTGGVPGNLTNSSPSLPSTTAGGSMVSPAATKSSKSTIVPLLIIVAGSLVIIIACVQYEKWQEGKRERERHMS